MFVFVPNLTCWWPVKVQQPDPDNAGQMTEFSFEIEFEILDRDESRALEDERTALLKKVETDASEENLRKVQDELDALAVASFRRVIRNWRGIVDEDKKQIPFSDVTFTLVMKHNRIRAAINRAYQEAIAEDKARLGN